MRARAAIARDVTVRVAIAAECAGDRFRHPDLLSRDLAAISAACRICPQNLSVKTGTADFPS